MPGYKLIVKNAKVFLKTVTNAVLNISGIKDLLTGDGSVDSNNKINWTLQEYTNTSANFTSINPVLLLGQKGIETDDLLTTPKFKIGDGVTAWNTLPYFSIGGSSGVQSVTGPQVDDTDPNNPIVNPLGLIQIIDLNGELFTDITTAKAYIRTFIDEINYPITNESFEKGVFYFTVPRNTVVSLDIDFMSNTSAWFVDEYGLILAFSINCFNFNSGDNLFGRPDDSISVNGTIFQGAASFESASGTNLFISIDPQTVIGTAYFGENATGKFIFENNIGASETVSLPEFFNTSTATIFVNASKYTSNSGGINASLQTAITNGCNVFFDGIDKEDKRNKSTSIITDLASNIKYPSVKSVYDWVTSTFATIASLASYVTITGTETLTNKTIKKRILVVTQSATPSTNIDNGDIMQITGLAQAITSMTTNLTGTPYDGQMIMWQVTDNGTARAITWGASFASTTGATLPTTTVISTMLRVITQYNLATSKHECQYVN